MKNNVIMVLVALLLNVTNTTYAQGVKLSSFPLVTTVDNTLKFVVTQDSFGQHYDRLFPTSLYATYLHSVLGSFLDFDYVLHAGNMTDTQAIWSDGLGNTTTVDDGVLTLTGIGGYLMNIHPGTMTMTNSAHGFVQFTIGAIPSVQTSNIDGSHMGSVYSPTLTGDRSWRMPDSNGTVALVPSGGLGTVTSVGEVAGYGVTIGGTSPITSAGTYTVTVDSSKFTTLAQTRRIADSVAVSSSATLTSVLAAGNTANNTLKLQSTQFVKIDPASIFGASVQASDAVSNQTFDYPKGWQWYHQPSGISAEAFMGDDGGAGDDAVIKMSSRGGNDNVTNFYAGGNALPSSQTVYMPDINGRTDTLLTQISTQNSGTLTISASPSNGISAISGLSGVQGRMVLVPIGVQFSNSVNVQAVSMGLNTSGVGGYINIYGTTGFATQFQSAPLSIGQTLYTPNVSGTNDTLAVKSQTTQIVSKIDLAAQTTSVTAVASYSVTATGDYAVNGYVNVTAVSTDVINYKITWTDKNATSQTITGANISTVGYNQIAFATLNAKIGTSIVVSTVLSVSSGSITYDIGERIIKQ